MISAAADSSFLVFRILPAGLSSVSVEIPADQRHHRHTGLETRQPERELGKEDDRHHRHHRGIAVLREQRRAPVRQHLRMPPDLARRDDQDDGVERQVRDHDHDGQPDRFLKSSEKDGAEEEQQHDRDQPLIAQPGRRQRVLHQMRRGVGRRQRNRDDEARRGKPQQRQDQRLSLPPGKQLFEDQDAALAVRTHVRDAVVHRQGAEQRQDHEHERRHRRERAGGEKRDARLIREGREIVDAGEAHHLPPVGRVLGPRVRADGFGGAFEKPAAESLLEGNGRGQRGHRRKL